MKMQPDGDELARELASMRRLIDGHAQMQQLLDLAADEADRRSVAQERSRQIAWRVTGVFGVAAVLGLSVAAMAVATALRPAPAPSVLVVDKTDGLVRPLISLEAYQMAPEEATIRRNVNSFVLAREGYTYEHADTHYYTTAAFLSPQLQGQWGQLWEPSNPESPPNKYKKERRLRVNVGAITLLRNGLGAIIGARASFTRTELVNDVVEGQPSKWVATLALRWVNQPTSERDRRINDLGMEITDYVADRDLAVTKPELAPAAERASESASVPAMALMAPDNGPRENP